MFIAGRSCNLCNISQHLCIFHKYRLSAIIAAVGGLAMTLHATLQEGAKAFPDRCWLRFGEACCSYAEGDAQCEEIAQGLVEQGVKPGDRVGLLFTNCADLVFCF